MRNLIKSADQADNITPPGFRHENEKKKQSSVDKLNLRSKQLVPNFVLYPYKCLDFNLQKMLP